MPGTNDSDDQDLDLELDDQDGADDADGAGDGADAADDQDGKPAKGEDKRISKLQSEKDKETARANKAEAALKRLEEAGSKPADGKPSDRDPERAALLEEIRESALDAIFAENPDLKTYGISRDLFQGSGRAAMRAEAEQVVGLIKSVETKVRNRVLKEHGITAEPTGTTRSQPKNYAAMSEEEIEKEIAAARSGGVPGLW